MIQHHPDDEFMLGLAAGNLRAGEALVVSTHLEACAGCRTRLYTLQALGGRLLAETEPVALGAGAWANTLERIDQVTRRPASAVGDRSPLARPRPLLPHGLAWPASLRDALVSRWRFMGRGMRFARVAVGHDPGAKLFLLHVEAGRSMPRHAHTGVELSQVLCGELDDGRAVFGPGDFDCSDDEVHHQPVVRPGTSCVCLVYLGGRMRFDTSIASLMGGWIGL